MAKSKKKTMAQQIVGTAAIGMPAPAKKILASRIGALLIVIVVPVLLATGIVSVKWENGRPKVSLNRERAAEVKEKATERIEEFEKEHDGERPALADYVPRFGEQEEKQSGFAADLKSDVKGFEHRVAERYGEVKDKLVGDDNHSWNIGPPTTQPNDPGKQAFQPFQGVREKIEDLRR